MVAGWESLIWSGVYNLECSLYLVGDGGAEGVWAVYFILLLLEIGVL